MQVVYENFTNNLQDFFKEKVLRKDYFFTYPTNGKLRSFSS